MADDTAWDKEVPGDRERHTLLGSESGLPATRKPSLFRRWWPAWLVGGSSLLLAGVILINFLQPSRSVESSLRGARLALQEGRLDEATAHLRGARDRLALEGQEATGRAEYHALAAAMLRLRQSPVGPWPPANAERVIDHLVSAQESGWTMTAADWECLGLAHIQVGQVAAAQEALNALQGSSDQSTDDTLDDRILQIRRAMARYVHEQDSASPSQRILVLKSLRDDVRASLEDMAWSAAAIARIRLDAGQPSEAAIGLHRDIRRMEGQGGQPSPELLVLLGRSNRDLGRPEVAAKPLQAGLDLAGTPDPIRGEGMVLLGDVHAHQGDLETARQWYNRSIVEYPAAQSMLAALVGRGRMSDLLNEPEQALLDFTEAVRRVARGDQHVDVTVATLEAILLDRFESALTRSRTTHALALARLASSLRPKGQRSARVSTALAVAAGQVAADRTKALELQGATWDDETWAGILDLHAEAGEAHLEAAEASGNDEAAWADALFHAGVHLDAAGRQQDAAAVFLDYVHGRGERDPVRVDAMFRLAQALEADLAWEDASTWYDRLLTNHPRSLQATRSYVPSARCLLALGQQEEARCRLQSVVDGQTTLTPGAPDYRDTLVMLGRLCVDEGAYSEAISRLREAADRWPDHPDTIAVLFDIASARRSLALSIDQRLAHDNLTPSQRQSLESDRLANLWEAAMTFEQVIEALALVDPPTPNSHRRQRAAAVARADCLLETGRLQEAILCYESVARTWPNHPAAMHSLVQVASAWTSLGELDRADAAHRRALDRLGSLPDDVLDREGNFMSRAVWERWLNTIPVGSDLYAGASTTP
ncbi:MAG: tetratricopeptide repeat protein [Planctomycetota bacterium]|nr:tetratricopeptide repeat protein [Planctomycetota bacterium]